MAACATSDVSNAKEAQKTRIRDLEIDCAMAYAGSCKRERGRRTTTSNFKENQYVFDQITSVMVVKFMQGGP
jgi:hypothetical protein